MPLQSVVLPAASPDGTSKKPTVRIFVGTESAQYRAERVLVWSIEKVRDPERRYIIYLMKELPGFDRGGWTTGFTNYRFAIPHLAGASGRAIYNDEDQIYLSDPGELFDLEMGDHGMLAISATESSVALLDCARMADVWSLDDAQHRKKKALLARAAAREGLIGDLDPAWNTRDADEYDPQRSKLYHYTTLHTQPWRPFPERFIYHGHRHDRLWFDLERSADAAGFRLFDRHRAGAFNLEKDTVSHSPACQTDVESFFPQLRDVCGRAGVQSVAMVSPGALEVPAACDSLGVARVESLTMKSLAERADDEQTFDAVIFLSGLDMYPDDDLPWMIDLLFRSARKFVFAGVSVLAAPPRPRRGQRPKGSSRTSRWWSYYFESAGRLKPDLHWELATTTRKRLDAGTAEYVIGGQHLGSAPPSLWVLLDDRPGNSTQSVGLAEELAWPYETKPLDFNFLSTLHNELLGASLVGLRAGSAKSLRSPWPDLVIAAGRRTAPAARWIREHSRGRTRVVQLGRKGAYRADLFDLAVTPSYTGLLPDPRRIETGGPLTRVRPSMLNEAADVWRNRFESSPRPRIALLVGGGSARHDFTPELARRIGEEVSELAREAGGSIFATTSRRTPGESVDALEQSLGDVAFFYRWKPDAGEDNPYFGFLALADVLIVTDDSESMVAEACACGKPVLLYPIPVNPMRPIMRMGERITRLATARPLNNRGTTRPQDGLQRFCSMLLARGYVRPPRDLERMREQLAARGLARVFDGRLGPLTRTTANEVEQVSDRVKRLMGFAAETFHEIRSDHPSSRIEV